LQSIINISNIPDNFNHFLLPLSESVLSNSKDSIKEKEKKALGVNNNSQERNTKTISNSELP